MQFICRILAVPFFIILLVPSVACLLLTEKTHISVGGILRKVADFIVFVELFLLATIRGTLHEPIFYEIPLAPGIVNHVKFTIGDDDWLPHVKYMCLADRDGSLEVRVNVDGGDFYFTFKVKNGCKLHDISLEDLSGQAHIFDDAHAGGTIKRKGKVTTVQIYIKTNLAYVISWKGKPWYRVSGRKGESRQ